ncbi:MAG: double-strand break repair helicase AddA, partial [Micavibrio aeruginosavorus]
TVETPGGLNIMTIHSFCQSVLGRFPIEAGLPPNFKPLEEDESRALLDRARKEVIARAGRDPASPLGEALAAISALLNEEQFAGLLLQLQSERHQTRQLLSRTFGVDGLYTSLCKMFGITAGQDIQGALAAFCRTDSRNEAGLREACTLLSLEKTKEAPKAAANIQAFLDGRAEERPALYDMYKYVFLTKEGTPRAKIATAGVLKTAPHIGDILSYEQARIIEFEEECKSIACANATRDLFLLSDEILNRYQDLKDRQGALDFNDMILRTLSLLKGESVKGKNLDVAPWVMYKLDEGIDHILVDEAQDTNPEQWDIINLLSDEFFAGQGVRDETIRTVFVVGDDKQSIFGFQRAAPEKFGEMYEWFARKVRSAGGTFVPVDITTSFRSVQTVLDAVDQVFTNPSVREKFTGTYLNHIAKRQGQSGIVELWPLFKSDAAVSEDENDDAGEAEKGWFVPDRILEALTGSEKMARKIGDTIQSWLKNGETLHSYGRPIHAGDIMILVRSRSRFVGQLVRALKARNIPVSGVDRMVLSSQIVVQDMIAAAQFGLLPEDNLTLAALLKSPFVGMNEDEVFRYAHGRTGSLWDSIRENAPHVSAWLERLIVRSGIDHPYEFFSRIVQEPCPGNTSNGMQAVRARLGEDALDPLDEFLNAALAYEASHTASLQDFLQWHAEGSGEIKREMDESSRAVRIMTAHGSKGLQAPIVFLPDTILSGPPKTSALFWPDKTGLDVPMYLPSKDATPKQAAAARTAVLEKSEEEYRRLLYVAMTRAEERLYIGGYTGKKTVSAESRAHWYTDVQAAFETLAQQGHIEKIPSGVYDENGEDIPALRLASSATESPDKKSEEKKEAAAIERRELPRWVKIHAPAEPVPPRPLVPSRPSEEEPAAASPLQSAQEYRFRRGNATHKLLQLLPSLPPERRRLSAEQFLARPALGFPADLQKDIAREVMNILEDETFGEIFGEQSLAEIPVTGLIGKDNLISGQIDRLLVRENDILIVDYKTNRPSPKSLEDVPKAYIRQLRAYADALRGIYKGKAVRAALLWTDDARLVEIPV